MYKSACLYINIFSASAGVFIFCELIIKILTKFMWNLLCINQWKCQFRIIFWTMTTEFHFYSNIILENYIRYFGIKKLETSNVIITKQMWIKHLVTCINFILQKYLQLRHCVHFFGHTFWRKRVAILAFWTGLPLSYRMIA